MALSEAAIGLNASYPAQAPQVSVIRRAVGALARRGGADEVTLDRIALAVSEAATNVVLHAYRETAGGGLIHVMACTDHDALEVSVRDSGGGLVPRPDSPGMGLGLGLMAGESDRFAVRSADGGGTEVLMRFTLRATRRPLRPRLTAAPARVGEPSRI